VDAHFDLLAGHSLLNADVHTDARVGCSSFIPSHSNLTLYNSLVASHCNFCLIYPYVTTDQYSSCSAISANVIFSGDSLEVLFVLFLIILQHVACHNTCQWAQSA
jgi:hypothetical protein